jgi:hypothetical protein
VSGARRTTRYVVRNREGRELTVPSLESLHGLYRQGFLTDEDEVRQESSTRWVKVGQMPALAGERGRRRDPRWALTVLLAAVALVAAVALLLAGRRLR